MLKRRDGIDRSMRKKIRVSKSSKRKGEEKPPKRIKRRKFQNC